VKEVVTGILGAVVLRCVVAEVMLESGASVLAFVVSRCGRVFVLCDCKGELAVGVVQFILQRHRRASC
jgi:uncharacterized membrane protein YeaQ/YmgE (transglycosylase-associated protein family)